MSSPNQCPKCSSENIYQDGNLWICPECSNEWSAIATISAEKNQIVDTAIKDAHGNILIEGDTVTVIKDLKINGSSSVVKSGTKVKNIRLIDDDDGHNISCRLDGFGVINLKSEFVKSQ